MRFCIVPACLLLLASCASPKLVLIEQRQPSRAPHHDVGDRTEVHTVTGVRSGYAVRECSRQEVILAVDCLGAIERPHAQAELDALHRQLETDMKTSAVGVGFGVGCDDTDRGFRVYVRHYAEVDAAIERAGQLCVEHNTRARFSFHLLGQSQLL